MKTEVFMFIPQIESSWKKYQDHDLFRDCIEISCPEGWLSVLDKIVDQVQNFNEESGSRITFSQVKVKFGHFTVYAEIRDGDTDKTLSGTAIWTKIQSMAKLARFLCPVCGKQRESIVIESKVKYKCFDHWNCRV